MSNTRKAIQRGTPAEREAERYIQYWEADWNGDPTVYPGVVGYQYANTDHAIPLGAYGKPTP